MIDRELKGNPPYPGGYYRFNDAQFMDMVPPQGTIGVGDIRYRDYWGRSDFNGFRNMAGKPDGAISAYDLRNSFILKCNKIEYYKDHRDNQILTVRNEEIDYSMMVKGGAPVFNMSVAMVNKLKSMGFYYMQDMGSSGFDYGTVVHLDSANVKNNDWQWWGFATRYGLSYIRFFK